MYYSDGYEKIVKEAVEKYLEGEGNFVFTSSAGVFAENSGGIVDENSEVITDTDRSQKILGAENAVLAHPGGIVLRLGGLYTL